MKIFATKSLLSGPLQPALKGAPMDTMYHSEIGTPHTMIEVMNHIKLNNQSAFETNRKTRIYWLSR